MKNFFNLNNRFFTIAGKIGDALLLSVLFLVGCIPLLTAGASAGALYETWRIVILGEEGGVFQVFKTVFMRRLTKKLLSCAIYEAVLGALLVLLLLGRMRWQEVEWLGALFLFVIIAAFVTVSMLLLQFLLLEHTNIDESRCFALAFVLALRHLPRSLFLFGLLLGCMILTELFPPLLLIFPPLFCYAATPILEKTAQQYATIFERESVFG